jgi:hypothetical protein
VVSKPKVLTSRRVLHNNCVAGNNRSTCADGASGPTVQGPEETLREIKRVVLGSLQSVFRTWGLALGRSGGWVVGGVSWSLHSFLTVSTNHSPTFLTTPPAEDVGILLTAEGPDKMSWA